MVINIKTCPEYKVNIQKGCVCDGSMKAYLTDYKDKKAAVITDNNVAELYLDKVRQNISQAGLEVFDFVFEAGENNKTLQTVENIFDFLCRHNFTRTDIIIALGGGIVGDTAGFAAATYLRGIKYIQIPTTLLAMIDSSIGGKTAINLTAGKNLAGCFHQPNKVIIDIDFLKTLSQDEWQCGIGEMIKYGAIMDKKLFTMLEQTNFHENIQEMIFKCLNIKKKIVEKDTLDTGIRQILNFGHTLGHGIERHSNYSISHGKAIGIGMVIITKWAEERCLTQTGTALRIEKLLKKYNMPYDYSLSLEELWKYAINDKKKKGQSITLALIEDIGEMKLYDILAEKFLDTNIDIKLTKSELKGKIVAPPSKSMAHRAIYCAMLSKTPCIIKNIELSEDIQATINVAKALGKQIEFSESNLLIKGEINADKVHIYCNESGTTFRFLLPILSVLGITATLTGKSRLGQRPYDILVEQLKQKGAFFNRNSGLPLEVSGKIQGGDFYLRGDISSQFISGLLLSLPLLDANSKIIITSKLQSASYVDMTIQCMRSFGVIIEKTDYGFFVEGNQEYNNSSYFVEGDYSNAAFFLCGAALSGKTEIVGLDKKSSQGDKEIIDILKKMGADIQETPKGYKVKESQLSGIEVDARNIPDLVPILAITMAFANGRSVIRNTERLKIKECDRQQAIIDILTKMGAHVKLENQDIVICGNKQLSGGVFDGNNDHRIIMTLSIAALKIDEIIIKGIQYVKKSYPNFFLDYRKLGGQYVIGMGQ